jgi:hypothetical protein
MDRNEADAMERNEANEMDRNEANKMDWNKANEMERNEANKMDWNEANEMDRNEANEMDRNEANEMEQNKANEMDRNEANEMDRNEANEMDRTETKRTSERLLLHDSECNGPQVEIRWTTATAWQWMQRTTSWNKVNDCYCMTVNATDHKLKQSERLLLHDSECNGSQMETKWTTATARQWVQRIRN